MGFKLRSIKDNSFSPLMQLTLPDILVIASIIAVFLLIVLLYHLIFVAVDLRKIMQRMDDITEELEDIVMKPLSIIEESMGWIMEFLMSFANKDEKKKHKKVE